MAVQKYRVDLGIEFGQTPPRFVQAPQFLENLPQFQTYKPPTEGEIVDLLKKCLYLIPWIPRKLKCL